MKQSGLAKLSYTLLVAGLSILVSVFIKTNKSIKIITLL
jgi:hypothetical protein